MRTQVTIGPFHDSCVRLLKHQSKETHHPWHISEKSLRHVASLGDTARAQRCAAIRVLLARRFVERLFSQTSFLDENIVKFNPFRGTAVTSL